MGEVMELHNSSTPNVCVVSKKDAFQKLTARRGIPFWRVVGFWQAFIHARIRVLRFKDFDKNVLEKLAQRVAETKEDPWVRPPSAIGTDDMPAALFKKFQELRGQGQAEFSYFDRVRIDEAVPLQQLLQADTHRERLRILEAVLLHEKARMESEPLEELPEEVEPAVAVEEVEGLLLEGKHRSK